MKQLLLFLTLIAGINLFAQSPNLAITASTTASTCPGDMVTLTLSPYNPASETYEWSVTQTGTTIATIVQSITVSPTVTTEYSVTATSSFSGLSITVNYTVTVLPSAQIQAAGPFDFCTLNGPIQLYGSMSNGGTCNWYNWSESPTTTVLGNYLNINGEFTPPAPGIYDVYYLCNDGTCVTLDHMSIGVYAGADPSVQIDPIGPLDLCNIGSGVQLQASSNGGNCTWSEDGNSLTGNYLDASGFFTPTEPGVYDVYFECGVAPCVTTVSESITVVRDGAWHQYSESSAGDDIANDVVTDAQGNVYVIGTFIGSTTLNGGNEPDITISNTTGTSGTYVAKYDNCANLLWENHSFNSSANSGSSIAIDEISKNVYAVGNMDGYTEFTSSSCSGSAISATTGNTQYGYVIQIDMNSGCPNFIDDVSPTPFTSLSTIAIDDTQGAIFVGGHNNSTVEKTYVAKYTPSTTSIGTAIWEIDGTGNGFCKVNDLAFDNASHKLWMIGDYNNQLSLFDGSITTSIPNPNNVISDAWTACYYDLGTSTTPFNVLPGQTVGGEMYGNGIAVSSGGDRVFLTGTYTSNFNDVFILGSSATLTNSSGNNNAYHAMINTNSGTFWLNSVEGFNGDASGDAVATINNEGYFAGNYDLDGIMFNPSGNGENYIVSGAATPGNNHVYAVGYDQVGGYIWHNVTTSTNPAAKHNATSIAAGTDGNSFIVGSFENTMDYLNGAPNSGPLSSTGGTNAFVMRNKQSTGQLKSQIVEPPIVFEETPEGKKAGNQLIAQLSPNPNNGITKLMIDNFDSENQYTAILYNILGEPVKNIVISQETTTIDLSNYSSGMYVLRLNNSSSSLSIRLIKSN